MTRPSLVAADVVALCEQHGLTLATGESLTAGGLSAAIASIPGASAVLRGGVVAYNVDLKRSLLGVSDDELSHGIVSEEVARGMARGAATRCGATLGVGTTGVAGPSSHDNTAVGTVAIAVVGHGREVSTLLHIPGGRDHVIQQAIQAALDLVLRTTAEVTRE